MPLWCLLLAQSIPKKVSATYPIIQARRHSSTERIFQADHSTCCPDILDRNKILNRANSCNMVSASRFLHIKDRIWLLRKQTTIPYCSQVMSSVISMREKNLDSVQSEAQIDLEKPAMYRNNRDGGSIEIIIINSIGGSMNYIPFTMVIGSHILVLFQQLLDFLKSIWLYVASCVACCRQLAITRNATRLLIW